MKKRLLGTIMICCIVIASYAQKLSNNHYVKIEKPSYSKTNGSELFNMGTAVNPEGRSITINSQSLLINGKPVVPVMGEMHFSRVPEDEWEKELLKMKAGGINIVASYIFWIHFEEFEGQYNWAGQRNLRKFIETCKKVDLPLILRIGPWCHGECRNGGFPEWLVNSGIKLRNDNPEYLAKVRLWFEQIFNQAKGLLWKDGGSVIGIQLENEFRGHWEHLKSLKDMAQEIGFDTPIYTRTGWPALTSPAEFGEIIPLYGDYADGFWDRGMVDMPGNYSDGFLFRSFRNSTVIATEQLPKQSDKDNPDDFGYPYFTCELGGGMMTSYHRRINIAPMDVYSMALVRVGSGSNMPGYYMYHGGTNPEGKLTTMNEQQESNFTNNNDLPVKSYDFQAPLGEFGQINPQYHTLRRMHLFLTDFGDGLASMNASFPDNVDDPNNTSSLRWNVRSNGHSGYVFVNNYQRLKDLNAKDNISFTIDLPEEKITFPSSPITVPANSSFFLPFNMMLGAIELKYSTAQPVAKILESNILTVFFARNAQIPANFVFDVKGGKVEYSNVNVQMRDGQIHFDNLKDGMDSAIRLRDTNGLSVNIILLDEKTSLNLWKGELAGKERVFISNSEIIYHKNELQLTDSKDKVSVSIFPAPFSLNNGNSKLKEKKDGIFSSYEIIVPKLSPVKVSLVKIADAGPLREIKKGKAKVAESPGNDDFADAAIWKIVIPENTDRNRDIYLQLSYVGDVARVYAGNKFLTDNFYNGKPFEIGLKRFSEDIYNREVTIKILPLQKDAPIYIQKEYKPDFKQENNILLQPKVEIYEKQTIKLIAE